MTGILGQLKWESLKKRRKGNRLIRLYNGLRFSGNKINITCKVLTRQGIGEDSEKGPTGSSHLKEH